MTKLIFWGVGNGGTLNLYNTCLVIQNENGNFLIDTGGSIEIIKRLKEAKIDFKTIKDIFISHTHTDHILGLLWLFKMLGVAIMEGEDLGKIRIYCNDQVCEAIHEISKYVLPSKLLDALYKAIDFVVLKDQDYYKINGIDYTFFDIQARGEKQFGIEFIDNGKRVVFLGDETLNSVLYDKVRNADYVTHEAFCLDSEEDIYHACLKNHSTTKMVAETMDKLGVKNLILYHTEEKHGKDRKQLYTKEGEKFFKGKIYVPDELEEIEII